MTFEVYNQTLNDIERKISESRKNESDIVVRLDDDRQRKMSELKTERRKFLDDWEDRYRKLGNGATRVINQARESEREIRRRLDEQRRRLAHEYNNPKEANHED